ncbi:hypothetical protein V496_07978, partial [Pseudogymnoascus sp. VKM F-4515 (FW-2607)]
MDGDDVGGDEEGEGEGGGDGDGTPGRWESAFILVRSGVA